MNLFLVRHGTAEPQSPATPDTDRALSSLGQSETQRLGSYFASIGMSFSQVWASPFKRARQTADNIAKAIRSNDIKLSQNLIPEADPVELARWLGGLTLEDMEPIVVVGHQPSMGRAVSEILGIKYDAITIVPATVVELSFKQQVDGREVLLASVIPPDRVYSSTFATHT
jgi:phosphohistidine phosphatase